MTQPTPALSSDGLVATFADTQQQSLWSILPVDMIMRALSFCLPSEAAAAGMTCRAFRVIAQADYTWQQLYFRQYSPCAPPKTGTYFEACQKEHRLSKNISRGVCETRLIDENFVPACCLAFAEGEVGAASQDNTLKFWDLDTELSTHNLNRQDEVWSLARDKGMLAWGSSDNVIHISDLETHEERPPLVGHTGKVLALLFVQGKLISGSEDGTIRVWDPKTATCLQVFEGHEGPINCLAFGSQRLFSGSGDDTIRVWDLETGKCSNILRGHIMGVQCLAVQGNRLFSGCSGGVIKIWDIAKDCKCIETVAGHQERITALLYAKGFLISGSSDRTMRIWDLEKRRCATTLNGHEAGITSLAFAKGKLISGGHDHALMIWDFTASDQNILEELAQLFLIDHHLALPVAIERFSAMPKRVKEGIYQELADLLQMDLGDLKSIEDTFLNRNGRFSKQKQKAQAIKNYLKKLST